MAEGGGEPPNNSSELSFEDQETWEQDRVSSSRSRSTVFSVTSVLRIGPSFLEVSCPLSSLVDHSWCSCYVSRSRSESIFDHFWVTTDIVWLTIDEDISLEEAIRRFKEEERRRRQEEQRRLLKDIIIRLRVRDPSDRDHVEDVNVSKAHSVKSEKGRLLEKFGFGDHDLYDMVKHEDDGSIQVLNDEQHMNNYRFSPTSVLQMVPRGAVQERPPKRQEMDCQCQCHLGGCARGQLDSPPVQLHVDLQRGDDNLPEVSVERQTVQEKMLTKRSDCISEISCLLKVIDPQNNEHWQERVYLQMRFYVEMEKKELLQKYCPNLPADDYVLVKIETDGSVEVLDDRQLMKHYTFASTTTLQLAPIGAFEDRPPRGLNQDHLMNEFGVILRNEFGVTIRHV